MVNSAAQWLLRTGLNGEYTLEVWFSIFYAKYVEEKKPFMDNIKPDIFAIVQQEIFQAYRNNGIDAQVSING